MFVMTLDRKLRVAYPVFKAMGALIGIPIDRTPFCQKSFKKKIKIYLYSKLWSLLGS